MMTRRRLYDLARQAQADWYADEIVELSRDRSKDTFTDKDGRQSGNHAAVARDKLICENLKFLMAKLHPGRYGDKMTPEAQASQIAISWEAPKKIERIVLQGVASEGALQDRIRELEAELAEARGETPPGRPKLLTYDPGPLPKSIDPIVLERLVDTFKSCLPQDDQRAPETVLDEATSIIEAALRDHYGTA